MNNLTDNSSFFHTRQDKNIDLYCFSNYDISTTDKDIKLSGDIVNVLNNHFTNVRFFFQLDSGAHHTYIWIVDINEQSIDNSLSSQYLHSAVQNAYGENFELPSHVKFLKQ